MDQIELTLPAKPRARRADPIPSHAAADRAERFLRGHAAVIVALVVAHPGRTAKELAELGPLSHIQIDRRARELEEAGWIERPRKDRPGELRLFATERARRRVEGRG